MRAGFGNKITETERVAYDPFADKETHPIREHRAVENKGVKLTVFAAGIGTGRQIVEELRVEETPREASIKNFQIDANYDGAKS
jgi:hypothetical protein